MGLWRRNGKSSCFVFFLAGLVFAVKLHCTGAGKQTCLEVR